MSSNKYPWRQNAVVFQRFYLYLVQKCCLTCIFVRHLGPTNCFGVVHILRWQVFDFFWPPYPLRWHFLPYRNWQKFDIFGLQKHRPLLVNVVCELPLRKANQGVAQYFPLSVFPPLNPFHGQPWHLNECWQSEQNAEVVSLFSLN